MKNAIKDDHNTDVIGPVRFVKQSLWRRNIRARDVSDLNLGYELLVKNEIKVKVVSNDKMPAGVELKGNEFDVLCFVLVGQLHKYAYYLISKGDLKKITNSSGITFIDSEVISKYFTKKPGDVFNSK